MSRNTQRKCHLSTFHFQSDFYSLVIKSSNLSEALTYFGQALKNFYGTTFKFFEVKSNTEIAVYWIEEGEESINEDTFRIQPIDDNIIIGISRMEKIEAYS